MKTMDRILESGSTKLESLLEPIRAAGKTVSILGGVLVILGMLSIAAPLASGLAVQAIVGLFMIAAGVTWVAFSFQAKGWGSGLWEALVGVLAAITGVVMLAHPLANLAGLTLVLASYFIATGILRSVFAFQLRPLRSWGWVFFNGIMSVVLGVMISYQWPLSGAWAVGTLLGVDLIFGGFSLIRIGTSSARFAR
ncbi:MAG: hypothetical protein KCHDKBKB_02511 [Elusimicrobia bacterium]|nr:hypothetical protein [Elusimicrobiota bacterium]